VTALAGAEAATEQELAAEAYAALHVVLDPELDEPITDLGFVRSVALADGRLEVHLRLPTSFCSPSFAYLMASDAKDALLGMPWVGTSIGPVVDSVVVELDDHHDSARINAGLAADLGWRGTYAHEEADSLEELRATFRRKAHTAAMERCLTALLRARPDLAESDLGRVVLDDLPDDHARAALLRRREALGLPLHDSARVLVDEHGHGYSPEEVPMAVRRARATRISVDGNAHFCRGLLRTRYPGAGGDQSRRTDGEEPSDPTFVALTSLLAHRPTTTTPTTPTPEETHS
jgi:metal-sulfur cluster biosynthetic enzyme